MSALLFYLHVYYSNSCVCVSEPVYAFPSSSIFIHIYRHFHVYCLCYVLCWHPCLCAFLLFPKLNRHLCHGVYWCNHTPTHILILWFRLYLHFVICTSTMSKSIIKFTTTSHKQWLLRNMNNMKWLSKYMTEMKIHWNSNKHKHWIDTIWHSIYSNSK